ncbi:MAG TPA: alpha-L-fucosidase [Capsulimonadaceae bacterium]|jgi:alpha-L-fucosidase
MSTTASEVAAGQHAQIGVLTQTDNREDHTSHPDAQWFPGAGLGVFLHWGISSVTGEGDLSWSMMHRPAGGRVAADKQYGPFAVQRIVPPAQYWKQAEDFLADRYDPKKWMAALKAAGVRYAVLTTKHHDGFALWPSNVGDFNTKNYLGGRDLVGEFVEACREFDIKIGFYYSPPDWWFDRNVMSFNYGDNKPTMDIHHQAADLSHITAEAREAHAQAHREFVAAQTEELLTRYGKIDILWFDGSADNAMSMERIRELQPGILVNRRGLGIGDFETPECAFPKEPIPGWWEYCHIWNDGAWGYLKHETYKPIGWLTGELVKARAWGGNMLINMGPDMHGELPYTAYRRLEELGEWLKVHGEAVFDVEAGPWPDKCNVPVTVRGGTWYIQAHALVEGDIVLSAIDAPKCAHWMRSGEPVQFAAVGGTFVYALPSGMPSADGDVIVVNWG